MRKLPSASEMEHITSKEFGENMDAILDRVLKEDIALVIDHENKSYVLCPSRWFEPLESTQMEVMVKNAVRYVAQISESDLAETAKTVTTLAPALSPECIATLLEIIHDSISDDCRSEWREMDQVLKDTLVRKSGEEST